MHASPRRESLRRSYTTPVSCPKRLHHSLPSNYLSTPMPTATSTQTPQTQPASSYRRGQGRRTNKPRNRAQDSPATIDPPPQQTSTDNNETPTVIDDGKEEEANVEAATTGSQSDADICWICAEPVKFYSLSECNHRTCHVCALRLRALYKKTDCTFCKVRRTSCSSSLDSSDSKPKHPQNLVVFTSSAESPFEDYRTDEMPYKDSKLAIVFETQEMMEETLILLRFNCPDEECPFIARGWNELKVHVRGTHGKQLWCVTHS